MAILWDSDWVLQCAISVQEARIISVKKGGRPIKEKNNFRKTLILTFLSILSLFAHRIVEEYEISPGNGRFVNVSFCEL